jgi:undecaprenyl-diphosphatase
MIRTPTSLFRLVIGLLVLSVGVLTVWRFDNSVTAFFLDLDAVTKVLPEWLSSVPLMVVTSVLVLTPFVVNVRLLRARSWRLLGLVNLAGISAMVLSEVLVRISTTTPPSLFPDAYRSTSDLADSSGFVTPNDALVAGFVAALVVGLPYLNRTTKRLGVGLVLTQVVVTFTVDAIPPVGFLVDIGAGITCGALVALAFGTPDSRPAERDIVATLARNGFRVASAAPASVDARGSTPWFARTMDGRRLFVKVLDQDNRSADLLFRVIRVLTFRSAGDERPFPSLRRAVEHEALLSLRASSVGVRTPDLEAVSTVGNDGMLLAFDAIDGDSLDRVEADDLDDGTLDEVWGQLATMRSAGIAHRDLRLANVFLAEDGRAWIIDFGFAELAASNLLLDTDVAELLGSTATVVGVERAVAAAERNLGHEALADCLPRLQPFALGSATRTALRDNELFEPLRAEVQRQAGVRAEPLEPVEPVRPWRLLAALAVTAVFWVVLATATDELDSFRALTSLEPLTLAAAAAASFATYVGATLAQTGAFRDALQFIPTFESRLASSVANRLTGARRGGLALGVRFLQRQGVTADDALQSVGLVTVTGLVVHLLLLIVASRIGIDDSSVQLVSDPAESVLPFAALVLTVVTLVAAWLVPGWRSQVTETFVPAIQRAGRGLREVVDRPRRIAQLLVGSVLVTAAYTSALVFSAWSVGVEGDFLELALTFLIVTVIAAPAPTPGGLVVVELLLVAGLALFGVPLGLAIPTVFLYRLLTFWLPVAPGLWAYRSLVRAGRL